MEREVYVGGCMGGGRDGAIGVGCECVFLGGGY